MIDSDTCMTSRESLQDVAEELNDGPPVIIKSKRETDKGLDESPSPTIDPLEPSEVSQTS